MTGYNLGTLQRLIEAAPPGSIDTVRHHHRQGYINHHHLYSIIPRSVHRDQQSDSNILSHPQVLSYCRATLFDRSLLGHSLQFFKQQNIGWYYKLGDFVVGTITISYSNSTLVLALP